MLRVLGVWYVVLSGGTCYVGRVTDWEVSRFFLVTVQLAQVEVAGE